MPMVELASPFHDPEGRLIPMIDSAGKSLLDLYRGHAVVSTTSTTLAESKAKLQGIGFETVELSGDLPDTASNNYRSAIRSGLKSSATHIHLVDFDRALHWAKTYPDELSEIIKLIPETSGLVTFTRSVRALNTHPDVQLITEFGVNEEASKFAGKNVDIMSGAFALDRNLSELILLQSKSQDASMYAEFLKIAVLSGLPIDSFVVEGLEWETPDQYQDEIKKEGYNAWLDKFEINGWDIRTELVEKSSEILR